MHMKNIFLLGILCRSTVGSSGRVMTTHAAVLPGQVVTISILHKISETHSLPDSKRILLKIY